MNDLVSIIMPSYNTASYISESVQSVVLQTYNNWELIIVDDCSSDNTDDVVKVYLDDKRITYIKNMTNQGAAISRNRALKEAKGKWIAFLDSDDLWYPEKLQSQIDFMENNNYHFTYTAYEEISVEGNLTGVTIRGPRKITRIGMYAYCWPGCLTVMYNREKVGLIQIEDIKKNNDYAMWLKVSQKLPCYYFNNILAQYRRGRNGSISTHGITTMMKWHYKLFRDAEKMGIVQSVFHVCVNICCGLVKKMIYVKR